MRRRVRRVLTVCAVVVAALAAGMSAAPGAPVPYKALRPHGPPGAQAKGKAAEAAPRAEPVKAAAVPPIPPAELQAFVDGVAAEAMAQDHIAGAAVAVVQNGQVVLAKGYGVDRLQPARAVDPARTLFRLGEITQTFTWIELMREIEAGHMRLDAPVNLYLPQSDQIRDQGYAHPVLVRHLLSHTAGFEVRTFGQLIERNPARVRPLEVYLRQERPRRVREPGALPTLSAYGASLAGEALAQVTGLTPQALAEQRITRPLRLGRTTLREPYPARQDLPAPMDPALADDLSEGYGWTGSGFAVRPVEHLTQVAPAGAGSSTAADMARYMTAILNDGSFGGATLYSPAIAQDFRTPLQAAAPGVRAFDHGFMEFALPGGRRGFGHEGATLSFRANMVTVPDLGLGVFVAANTDTARAFTAELPARIVQRFYGGPAPLPPPPSAWLKANAQAFEGIYLTTARAYSGLEAFADLLRGEAKVTVRDGMLLTPGPSGPRRWTPDAAASLDAPYVTFHQIDGPADLVFEIRQGRAARWFAPSGQAVFERSGPLSHIWLMALMAGLTGVASLAALAGLFFRSSREFRQTSIQGRADAAQISASILWLGSLGSFWIWSSGAADSARLMYGWPGAWLLIASVAAFAATVMTLLCLGLLPVVWRGGRRVDSWDAGRKATFSFTTLVFALFALLLGLWGALEPWSR